MSCKQIFNVKLFLSGGKPNFIKSDFWDFYFFSSFETTKVTTCCRLVHKINKGKREIFRILCQLGVLLIKGMKTQGHIDCACVCVGGGGMVMEKIRL